MKARSVPISPLAPLALSSLLLACGGKPAAPGPLHYPALSGRAPAVAPGAAFEPSTELVTLALACDAAEPELANALDDDCDGRLDGAASDEELVIALAYPRAAQLAFTLRGPGAGEPTELAPTCDAARAYCTLSLRAGELARGRHALLVSTVAEPLQVSVLVSVQARGGVATYIASLDAPAREPRALGEIALR